MRQRACGSIVVLVVLSAGGVLGAGCSGGGAGGVPDAGSVVPVPLEDASAPGDRDAGGGPRPRADAGPGPDRSDASAAADGGACPAPARVDYSCTGPASCRGGLCVAGLCLGPDADPERWASCGDGACGACESAASCRADCDGSFVRSALPRFDPATTITLKLHGLSVGSSGSLEARTYGEVLPDGALEAGIRPYAPDLPDGLTHPDAPNQLVAVEYYGRTPAAWMTPEQIARVEALDPDGPESLERYATIVAMFARERLARSGATHLAIACHSMGCHVLRFLVEHDLEGLASEGRIARVVSVAGALAGAGLAELYDTPAAHEYAVLSPISTTDFVHLHPDYVTDHVAIWDHRLHEANNPTWAGILLHQITCSDPAATTALGGIARPLDVVEPGEPNDSILYARDTFFTAVAEDNLVIARDGTRLAPSQSWTHARHHGVEEDAGALAITAAALWHRRRVTIRMTSLEVLDDHERRSSLDLARFGDAPAEVAPEVVVRLAPGGAIVHERRVSHRSADLVIAREGEVTPVSEIVFDAPVFDDQRDLVLELTLREVDRYERFGVDEAPPGVSLLSSGDELLRVSRTIPLEAGTIELESEDARATLVVDVVEIY